MTPRKSPDENSVALITGASRGIGLELAKECAKHGHDVVLIARRQDALEAAAGLIEGKYGVRATVVRADLSDPAAPSEISAAMTSQQIEVHMLINNAGFGLGGELLETDI